MKLSREDLSLIIGWAEQVHDEGDPPWTDEEDNLLTRIRDELKSFRVSNPDKEALDDA